MTRTKMLIILVLAMGQVANAAQSLTVNGEAIDVITLKTGQTCTVEVVSDNSNPYSAYVGFDDRVVLGSFDQELAMPEAGDLATIIEYDIPTFYGYYVSAAGTSPPPSPGVHFTIEYEPQQVGETEFKLYDPTRMTVIATVHITVVAAQMGTVFTYQGRLMEADNPTDGQYDFEFMLYNAPSYGSQLAGTGEANDLDVINGYFTVELDFGSNVFDSDAVWLEISVRPGDSNDPNSFVTLSPRQRVTPTPYALQTRGIFVDNLENIGMGTTSPKGKLHIEGGKAADDTDASDITIKAQDGGDAVRGLIGRRGGDIILLPGEGGESPPLTKPGPSGKVGIGTVGPEAMLDVRGNIKVDQKIQAYDSGGLELATDEGTTRIFVEDDGKVGIGTTTPRASLEVTNAGNSHAIWASTSDIPVYAHRIATTGTWPAVAGDCNSQASNASGVRGRILSTSPGSLGAGVYGYNYGTGSNGVGVRGHHAGSGYAGYFTGGKNYFEGNVGIGTTNPAAKLDVVGSSTDAVISAINSSISSSSVAVYGSSQKGYGVKGTVTGNATMDSYGVYGRSSSPIGTNYGVYGAASDASSGLNCGVYGIGYNPGTGNAYAGYFEGDVFVKNNVSAYSYTDRTPYPKDLTTAYEAVMSMERLPDGQYDENNKENQLDRSMLSDFVRSEDGNRDLSATVSCHNEVLKDLIRKQRELSKAHTYIEQLQKQNELLETRLVKLEATVAKINVIQKGGIQ